MEGQLPIFNDEKLKVAAAQKMNIDYSSSELGEVK